MCDSTQGSLCPSPMKIHQSMWKQWPFLQKTWTKGHWPLDDLWPHICWGHMCDSTQGLLCPSPMKIHQSMWIQWPFLQKLNQRSLTPRWPLTPHLLRSHVWLYPRIIVSSPMGIHQCIWIQWSILQITTYYIGLLHAYYIQNQWSHSLSQAKQQKETSVWWKWMALKIAVYWLRPRLVKKNKKNTALSAENRWLLKELFTPLGLCSDWLKRNPWHLLSQSMEL